LVTDTFHVLTSVIIGVPQLSSSSGTTNWLSMPLLTHYSTGSGFDPYHSHSSWNKKE